MAWIQIVLLWQGGNDEDWKWSGYGRERVGGVRKIVMILKICVFTDDEVDDDGGGWECVGEWMKVWRQDEVISGGKMAPHSHSPSLSSENARNVYKGFKLSLSLSLYLS